MEERIAEDRHLRRFGKSRRLLAVLAVHGICKLVWRYHLLLSGILAKRHLHRVSYQSRLSANDKSGNDMIPAAVHRSPGIYPKAEENTKHLS